MEEAKKARGTMAKQINVTTEQSFQDAFDGRVLVEAKGTELMHHCKYRAVGEDPYGSELYRGLLMDCPGPHLPRPAHVDDVSYPATHLAFVELHVSDRESHKCNPVIVSRLLLHLLREKNCNSSCVRLPHICGRDVIMLLQVEHGLGREKPKVQAYLSKRRQVQQRRSAHVSVPTVEPAD